MTFYKGVTIDITEPQIRKAVQGKQITLSKQQLQGSGYKLHVHPEVAAKIAKAKKKGTGTRVHLSPEGLQVTSQLEGGALGDWLKKAWGTFKKDIWPAIKPAVSLGLDSAVAPLATSLGPYGAVVAPARQAVKSLTGVGLPMKKNGKGSEAMKEKMAMLRARRGGSFRLS